MKDSKYYDTWNGFSLYCPDYKEIDFKLQNTLGDSFTKYVSFEIRRCVNTTENNNWCHEDEEIDEYLAKTSIEIWTIQTKVDMSKYDEPPLYRIMTLENKKLLNREYQ